MIKKILILYFLFCGQIFANEPAVDEKKLTEEQKEEIFRQRLREKIIKDQKTMEEMFQSDDFKMLQKRMERLMESFGRWDDLNIDDFMRQGMGVQGLGGGMGGVETWWSESDTEKTFHIKAKQNKNDPFNITVEEGMIKIHGTTLNEIKNDKGVVISKSYSSVNSSQSIPADVNAESVRYDQDKNGNILVIFKKKSAGTKSRTKPKAQPKKENQDRDFKPLKPSKQDKTI